ncbi:MAG: TonB-dependent receptor [Proteobacteria bacterium]|nr:TonB-dependent receptor [Pseudomonadota bacterium]
MTVGISSDDDGTPVQGSDFKNTSAVARLSSEVREDLSLTLETRYADSKARSFPEDSGGPRLAVLDGLEQRDQTQFTFGATLGYDISESTQLNIQAGYAGLDALVRNPGIAPGVRDGVPISFTDATIKRKNLTINAVTTLSDTLHATAGVDYQDENGDSVGSVEFFPGFSLPQDFRLNRDIFGAFAEVRFDATPDLGFTASVRHDNPSSAGSETTSRIGVQYLVQGARLFASWGQAFKLPSFFALGNALVGNPNLRPETSDNWEVGAAYGDRAFSMTLSAFRNDYEDLIDFDSATFTMVNRDDVEVRGIELATDLTVSDSLSLAAHATHTDIDVKNATENLLQRPDWRGGISARWQATPDIRLNLDWLYVGESFDSSVPTGEIILGSYNRVDVSGSWSPTDPLTVWLALDNLFDEDYQEAVGFPGVGVRARIGFRYTL